MSDLKAVGLTLSHREMVALYVLLSTREESLDKHQQDVLERISESLYEQLSVSQMEEIESYYRTLEGNQ